MQTIIWDWNGTLLNDLDFCISTINILLDKRKLTLLDRTTYKEVFSFPVKDYYEAIGFDFEKEDFSIPAHQFIDLYEAGVKNCTLHHSTKEVLEHFKNKGIRQFVLSAMNEELLKTTLKQQGIFHLFEAVAGLQDHYAVSKVERGIKLIEEYNIDKKQSTIIGDTIHDFEVAENLGINCILIADGHQSKDRLQKTRTKVLNDLLELETISFQ